MHVYYETDLAPGTIEVDPFAKFLYLIYDDGTAMRYPIAVGREGRGLRRPTTVGDKREWPSWQPTANMLRSEPEVYGGFARGIPGGKASPLGARALYLYSGGGDTRFRIHGTNDLQSIGNSGSAGCIRMFNQDVIDLYNQVERGARVVIRSEEDSIRIEEENSGRGIELPAFTVDPEIVYAAVEQEQAEREERRLAREAEEAAAASGA
jgi:lipoprotein-anchoring transpeptidase ErfK/SrfK